MGVGTLANRPFVLCLALQAFYMLSFNMVTPLIAQYALVLGETRAVAGLVAGVFSFFALLFRPFVGYAADRLDRKRLMLGGLVVGAIALFGYSASAATSVLVGFRVLHALALSIQTTMITVIAVDYIPHDRIAEGVGYIGIAAMIGMSLGPGFGVILADLAGHQASFVGGGLLVLVAAGVALLLPVAPRRPAPLMRFSLSQTFDAAAAPLSIAALSFAFCAGLTSSFMVLVGTERAIAGVALFFFVSSVGMVAVRPLAGRITDRRGLTGVALVGFAAEAAAMLLTAFASSLAAILGAAVFRVFGQGAAQSSIQGCVLKCASDERRGVASSTFYAGIDAGQGLGAIVGGVIAERFGYAASFMTGPCVLAVGLGAFAVWKLWGGERGEEEREARQAVLERRR